MKTPTLPVEVKQALERADELVGEREAATIEQAANAENTRRTYASSWRTYLKWCALRRQNPIGDGLDDDAFADQVRRYLAVRRNKCKLTTLAMDLVVIDKARVEALRPRVRNHPVIVKFWRALARHKRARGDRKRKMHAITPDLLRQMADAQPATLRGMRDRALMLLCFHCGMRRSEPCEMQRQDVKVEDGLMVIKFTHSKTDQTWKGRNLSVAADNTEHCPVAAMREWLNILGPDRPAEFPLFPSVRGSLASGVVTGRAMTGNTVRLLVQRTLRKIGQNPDQFGGHSFRAGFITTARRLNVSVARIMQVTGHKSEKQVLEYVRDEEIPQSISGLMGKKQ